VKGLDDLAAALLAAGADPRRADVHPTPAQAFSEAGKVIVEVRDAEAIACAFLVRADARGAVLSDEAASRLGVCRASFVKNGQDITSLRVEELLQAGDHCLTFRLVQRAELLCALKMADLPAASGLMAGSVCIIGELRA
ncbi:unnamed protein product, partial [Symbiodinium sp. KB8]